MGKSKIVIIGGPTASGKTGLAIGVAERFSGEIISADSMQIYKRLDIGTAKPTAQEQAAARHHLIDICEPWENYSVAQYVKDANASIEKVIASKKLPVICGGTGLYIEALIHPTDYSEEADVDAELRNRLSALDCHTLWQRLSEVDPDAAAAIHENNKKRVVRALEIYMTTGKTKTQTDKEQRSRESAYDILLLLTGFGDRRLLYDRIDRRVDLMIEQGLVEETRRALSSGDLRPETTAYQAIGYKELFPYLDGTDTLENCVARLKQASRNYAKRQLTWFSRCDGVRVTDPDVAYAAVSDFLKGAEGDG